MIFGVSTIASFFTSMLLFGAAAALVGPDASRTGRMLWGFKKGYSHSDMAEVLKREKKRKIDRK